MAWLTILVVSLTLLCMGFASKKDIDTGACKFDRYNYDHELQAVDKIRALIGKTFQSRDAEGRYLFTVGICASLTKQGGPSDAGAFQQALTDDDKVDSKKFIIGSLTNTHLMAGRDWALLEYKNGDKYTTHCNKEPKRTVIMLACDESADSDDPKMIHITEETGKTEECYYLFEMKHKSLCPQASASVLSVGSILLIVFFCVATVYLLVGFLYQRFVLGSKGLEQIPNYEFWKDLGNLQADGCDLVCRSRGRQNTGFRGIGDEQLDSTDEIRDDNLLPM